MRSDITRLVDALGLAHEKVLIGYEPGASCMLETRFENGILTHRIVIME